MKNYILFVFLLLLLGSCKKEDANIGKVEITFINNQNINYHPLTVDIFALENTIHPIYTDTSFGSSGSVSLSYGNYVVRPSAANQSFTQVGFQLNSVDKNLKIEYRNGQGKVLR